MFKHFTHKVSTCKVETPMCFWFALWLTNIWPSNYHQASLKNHYQWSENKRHNPRKHPRHKVTCYSYYCMSLSVDGLKSSDQPFNHITGSVVYHLLYCPFSFFSPLKRLCGPVKPQWEIPTLKTPTARSTWKGKSSEQRLHVFWLHALVFSGVSVAVKCKLKIMSLTVSKHLREHITIFERGNPYILRLLCPSSPWVWNHQLPSTSHHPNPKPTWLGCTLLPGKNPLCFFAAPCFVV